MSKVDSAKAARKKVDTDASSGKLKTRPKPRNFPEIFKSSTNLQDFWEVLGFSPFSRDPHDFFSIFFGYIFLSKFTTFLHFQPKQMQLQWPQIENKRRPPKVTSHIQCHYGPSVTITMHQSRPGSEHWTKRSIDGKFKPVIDCHWRTVNSSRWRPVFLCNFIVNSSKNGIKSHGQSVLNPQIMVKQPIDSNVGSWVEFWYPFTWK